MITTPEEADDFDPVVKLQPVREIKYHVIPVTMTTPEEKPDFLKLGESDWTSMYECLNPDDWNAERREHAQKFAKGCDKIWNDYVVQRQEHPLKFFVWLCREAQVEVIHAEDALECHGMKDGDGFVPVLTLKELYKMWIKTLPSPPKTVDK
jgi:hypothetical protein